MPVYEYECQQCHRITEALQKFSDPPLTTCPHCTGNLRKLISQSTFHLKGSGWYVTDYARKGDRPVSKTDKPSDNTSSKSEGSGSDHSSSSSGGSGPTQD
jgi:putative FmdB family regulatory protein